jgi:rhodanese-related sulfurtransferase
MEISKFVVNNWYLFAALIVVLAMIAYDPLRRLIYRVNQVGPTELVTLINRQHAVVVDVRDASDFRTGHVVGALNLPFTDLTNRAAELDKYKGRPIVFTCRLGQSAVKAAVLLRKRGLENVSFLAGGLSAWEKAQLPMEK